MKYELGKVVVMSLGGSIMFPGDKPDVEFLKSFRDLILTEIKEKGRHFYIVVGGGRLCRLYNETAEAVHDVSDVDKDWLGIHVTRLNAQLLRTILHDVADPVVIDNHNKVRESAYAVTVGAGWKPGHSTDYGAVEIARILGIKEVLNISKPKQVYDKDPAKFPDAKPFSKLTWDHYFGFIPKEWTPGANVPFDPIASKVSKENSMSVIIINGNDLENFKMLLNGGEFEGTVIGG